jgi:hypothetical protein
VIGFNEIGCQFFSLVSCHSMAEGNRLQDFSLIHGGVFRISGARNFRDIRVMMPDEDCEFVALEAAGSDIHDKNT